MFIFQCTASMKNSREQMHGNVLYVAKSRIWSQKYYNSVNIGARHTKRPFLEREFNFAQDPCSFRGLQALANYCDNEKAYAFSLSRVEKVLTRHFLLELVESTQLLQVF